MFRWTRVELLSVAILPIGLGLAVGEAPLVAAPDDDPPVATAYGPVSYAQQVAPILEARCGECHGSETKEVELGLLTYEDVMKGSQYGTVIEAGDPDNSLLLEMVVAGEMPQEADPLPEEEIEILRSWIAAGAENN